MKHEHRSITVQRLQTHIFEVTAAIMAFLIGIAGVAHPHLASLRSPIGKDLDGWSWIWSYLYLVGAPAVVIGILTRHTNVRACGLLLLATGFSSEFVAALTGEIEARTFTYLAYALACILRVLLLVRVHMRSWTYEI